MHFRCENAEKQVDSLRNSSSDQTSEQKLLLETIQMYEEKLANLEKRFQDEHAGRERAEEQIESLKNHLSEEKSSQVGFIYSRTYSIICALITVALLMDPRV